MNVTLFDLLVGMGEDKIKDYKVYIIGNEGYYKFDIGEMRKNKNKVIEIVILNTIRKCMWVRM